MRIEADSLENAIQIASQKLNCSAIDIDFTVVQRPSAGVFGMFKKQAIIDAFNKNEKKLEQKERIELETAVKRQRSQKEQNSQKTANLQTTKKPRESKKAKKIETQKVEITQNTLDDIQSKLSSWLGSSGFDMKVVEVSKLNENEVYIKLDGDDNATLIGKEGIRYKAFSYMIYNWLNIRYGLNSLLEISEFLQNQKKAIDTYIDGLIPKIKSGEKTNTKAFDNIFVKIAYDRLKDEFKDKSVAIKSTRNGKIVVINE